MRFGTDVNDLACMGCCCEHDELGREYTGVDDSVGTMGYMGMPCGMAPATTIGMPGCDVKWPGGCLCSG